MATAPKVKFKTILEDFTPPEFYTEDIPPPTVMEVESLEHQCFYSIILLTTHAPTDDKSEYGIYLNETKPDLHSYFDRYEAVKNFAQNQLDNGGITGYVLHGYKMSPMQIGKTCVAMNKIKKFQVKKKTYLNGPLKDNEFIQKKGKHYA